MHHSRQTLGDVLVSGAGIEAMFDQHRIVQVGECSNCLRLHARHEIPLRGFEQFVAGLWTQNVSENPHIMQDRSLAERSLSQQLHDGRRIIAPQSFDRELCFQPFVVTLGVQLLEPTGEVVRQVFNLPWLGTRGKVFLSHKLHSINPGAAALGTLAVRPIGDQQ